MAITGTAVVLNTAELFKVGSLHKTSQVPYC